MLFDELPVDIQANILRRVEEDSVERSYLVQRLPKTYHRFINENVNYTPTSRDVRFYRCIKYIRRYHKVNNRLGIQEMLVKIKDDPNRYEYWFDYVKDTGVFAVRKYSSLPRYHYQRFEGIIIKGQITTNGLEIISRRQDERLCMQYMGIAFALVCYYKGKLISQDIFTRICEALPISNKPDYQRELLHRLVLPDGVLI